jgi:hypothetical protein
MVDLEVTIKRLSAHDCRRIDQSGYDVIDVVEWGRWLPRWTIMIL